MNWCVDAVAGALDITGAAPDFAVVYPHLHQRRGGNFRPMHAERDLIIAIAAARHCQCEVVENPLAETVHEGEPVRGRKIDARLPFLGLHCKLFGETLICIDVSSAGYSSTKRYQLLALIGHGPSAAGICGSTV